MKKININLYGGKGIFGGRETPLEAEITYCDKCEQCSFYKNGTCFNAGRWKANCKIGKKERVIGYTSRAKKYYEFKHKYTVDEVYHVLNEPNNRIGIVDDTVILNLELIKIDENMNITENVTISKNELVYIPLKDFTNEIIKRICDIRPRTLFNDGYIKRYYEEIVPRFLYELKTDFKDIYTRFINEYPEYDKEPDFVGRKAYIGTLNNGSEIVDCHSNKWIIENDEIVCYKWRTWLPFGDKRIPTEIRIKITDEMTCEIKDNSQVNDNTKFAD